ncbi:MAG: hypothetical protein ACYTCN_02425 [Planctomycetota bacterium]|jgi:hypothetical protein
MAIRVIFAPTADLARSATADVTIEAEYGSFVWEGSIFTAAHHQSEGPFAGRHQGGEQPAPCCNPSIPVLDEGIVGVSHMDLDTLGGVARAMGVAVFDGFESFWTLAEYVDISGPHKLKNSGASAIDLDRLYAFWAWSQANRLPRATELTDITEYVINAIHALQRVMNLDAEMIEDGRAFKANEEALNKSSLVAVVNNIALRKAGSFVNHLYTTVDGVECTLVLTLNTKFKAITLSSAEGGVDCCAIMQKVFGPDAGGHRGIAGSPRGVEFGEEDLDKVLAALAVVGAQEVYA